MRKIFVLNFFILWGGLLCVLAEGAVAQTGGISSRYGQAYPHHKGSAQSGGGFVQLRPSAQPSVGKAAEPSPAATVSVSDLDDPMGVSEDELATIDEEESAEFRPIRDPLSGLNKFVFGVNQVIDKTVLKPISLLYKNVTPKFFRTGVNNVLFNLREPLHFVNALLQFEGKKAATSFVRFLLNTVFGLGGLFDVATDGGLQRTSSDFGLTLSKWGVGEGFYLVLPILGPSNLRDAFGRVGDFFLDPVNLYIYNANRDDLAYARLAATLVDTRVSLLDVTNSLDKSADPYTSYKVTFTDNRRYSVDELKQFSNPQSVEEEFYEKDSDE